MINKFAKMIFKWEFLFYFIGFNLLPIVNGSSKKGISLWAPYMLCDDFKVLNNMSWWYDWQMDISKYYTPSVTQVCPSGTDNYMPEYVPMIWSYYNDTVINISPNTRFILGFNEPDRSDQANLTPKQCAKYWHEIERNSQGKPLVSPSSALSLRWYKDFFRLCKNCRIDYIAAHAYGCNANDVMSYLQKIYAAYGKKIWVTEFGCPYSANEDQQLHLMQTLLPQLEAADYIYRYAWFMARIKEDVAGGFVRTAASLFYRDSSTLTTIGEFYNNFQSHDNAPVVGK